MKILLTGENGQLGRELQRALAGLGIPTNRYTLSKSNQADLISEDDSVHFEDRYKR